MLIEDSDVELSSGAEKLLTKVVAKKRVKGHEKKNAPKTQESEGAAGQKLIETEATENKSVFKKLFFNLKSACTSYKIRTLPCYLI